MVCLLSVALLGAASGPLSGDLRERFAAGVAAHRAGDWTTAARELGDPVWAGTLLEDYALLFQADSLLKQGDVVVARALASRTSRGDPAGRRCVRAQAPELAACGLGRTAQ